MSYMTHYSKALADYLPAFADPDKPFLTYYSFIPDRAVQCESFTRGALWSLARRAAYVLHMHKLGKGDCFAHYFSGNSYADLAFRLGASMVGAVPVPLNWQSDTEERVAFKVALTESRVLVKDSGVSNESVEALISNFPKLAVFPVEKLFTQPELMEDEFCCDNDLNYDATRIIIFTSGTTGQPKGVCLSYRNYAVNRNTFESFLQVFDKDRLALLVVNPMYHANSTAITDWALRRPGTQLHLIERYSRQYWSLMTTRAHARD